MLGIVRARSLTGVTQRCSAGRGKRIVELARSTIYAWKRLHAPVGFGDAGRPPGSGQEVVLTSFGAPQRRAKVVPLAYGVMLFLGCRSTSALCAIASARVVTTVS